MEEKPPTQAGRDVPRSRTPRAAFSAPEQPAPPNKPAERAPRRASKPAPPVTFQPPTSGSAPTDQESSAEQPATRKSQPQQPAKATPPAASAAQTRAAKPKPEISPQTATTSADAEEAPETTSAKAAPRRRTSESRPAAATTPAKAAPGPRAARRQSAAKATAARATGESKTEAAEPADGPAAGPQPSTENGKAARRPARVPARTTAEAAASTAPTRKRPVDSPAPVGQADRTAAQAEAVATTPVPALAPEVAASGRTEAWAKLVADPGHAPELLALAAVQTIGPRAKDWAERHREAYPNATDAGLARLATKQFTRFGTMASVFGAVAGSYAPVALLGSSALAHAELVLHLAAAYGLDPTDEQRAAELLVLTRVHPTASDAEEAIAASRQPAYSDAGISDAGWRFGRMAATQAVGWVALRAVNRLFPGTSLLVVTTVSRNAVAALGTRATRFYSQSSQDAGSRV